MKITELLSGVEALKDFGPGALERLAKGSWTEDFSQGQVIIGVGHPVEEMSIIATGEVHVLTGSDHGSNNNKIVLSKGDIMGEISLLTGDPATAEVVAATSCRLVRIPHDELTAELGKNPLAARGLARLLKERLSMRTGDSRDTADVARARVGGVKPMSERGNDDRVLVLNLGSSSIKYAVYKGGEKSVGGLAERLGSPQARIVHRGPAGKVEVALSGSDSETALRKILDLLTSPDHGALERVSQLTAVGHRVVHGGVRFTESTVIDDAVKGEIERCSSLAPLHNPVNLEGIRLCEKVLPPGVPQVAVFDTAFHSTMPEHAYRYGLPKEMADRGMLRRFGFHGTSHKYVSQTAAGFLGKRPHELKMVTCHLGNGASMAAVDHGRSVDTTMGLTPLEGLLMGTRCGDLDPGLILHLLRTGSTLEEVDALLNKRSGLLGLSGVSGDMRALSEAADAGNSGALLAIQAFCYRVRKYVGSYAAAMDGLDVLIFTGGIGEHSAGVRSRVCHGLSVLGIAMDEEENRLVKDREGIVRISKSGSKVEVLVVPTDEEAAIAKETTGALKRVGISDILTARRDTPVPIGVSAHHVHLTQEHVEKLFGEGHRLTPRNNLSQDGYFACQETVDLVGPRGRVNKVRILGPVRPYSQVEISRTDEFKLGIDAPVRASGNIADSPGILLVGSRGELQLEEGVICAYRHIHMSPEDALSFGIRDRDIVRVQVEGERSLIFGDVLVRVYPGWKTEMHIDTDEANAAEVSPGMTATIESIQKRAE